MKELYPNIMLYFIPSPVVVKVNMIVSHAKDTYSLFIFVNGKNVL